MSYLSLRQAKTMACVMETLLPEPQFAEVRERMGQVGNELFDPRRFDDSLVRGSVPLVFTLIYWLPILCIWLAWRPVPFTRLSLERRQRLFHKLEHSRLYGMRGLYLAAKMFACMVYFHDESTWDYVGFDNQGQLPLEINRTALDDLKAAS